MPLLLLCAAAVFAVAAQSPHHEPVRTESALFDDAIAHGLPQDGLLLVADCACGSATLFSKSGKLWSLPFSPASAGVGAKAGSNKTPPGWHRVAERFGEGAPLGTVFVSRKTTGRILPPEKWRTPDPAPDAVLTRVMWLEGLEPGVNKGKGIDSHERYIYLHGTNQEQKLGMPASHGCLRFSNADIAKLFDFSNGVELFCYIK